MEEASEKNQSHRSTEMPHTIQQRRACSIVVILLLTTAAVEAANNRWSTNGPFGGFISSFSFHPQNARLIFATSSGGLFRSKNGGITWQRLDITEGNFTGYPVKIHPRDPGRILAGSRTLFTSTDQGDTWNIINNNPVPQDGFVDIEFHPTDPNVLYGVTFRSGVFKSSDGGKTWTAKNRGLQFQPAGTNDTPALEIDRTNPKVIYTLLASRKAFKTINGGENWKLASKGLNFSGIDNFLRQEQALVMDPKNTRLLYAAGPGNIFKTTDGAKSWTKIDCGCGAHEISIDPKNSKILYAALTQVQKSTDAGATWKKITVHPLFANGTSTVAVHPKISKQIFAGGFGGGIFRSLNAGASWRPVNGGVDDFRVVRVSVSPLRPKQIVATGPEIPFLSLNGGLTWSGLDLGKPGFGVSDIQIHPKNPNLFVAAIGSPGVAISRDAGKNWQHTGPATGQLVSEAIALDPIDQNTIYAAAFSPSFPTGEGGRGIAKTTDGGKTWKFVNRGLSNKNLLSLIIDPRNRSHLYAGTISGTVFRTTNGGNSWKGSKVFSGCCVDSIAIDAGDSKTIYVSGRQTGIFKSTDGGLKWKKATNGLPAGATFFFVHVDLSGSPILFAGGLAGLFVSTDRAENWSSFDSNGLGTFPIRHLIVNPANPNQLFIGADRGVFSYTRKSSIPSPLTPLIDQLLPSIGRVGDTISVIGSNFGSVQGDSKVSFAGADGQPASWSDSQISVPVPTGARLGPVTTTVTSRRSNPFEFILLPSDGNLEPTTGPAAGGTKTAILGPAGLEGTRFDVLFGSTLAKDIVFIGPNIVVCTTPPGTGTVQVSIITAAVTAEAGQFTYE